MVCYVGDVVGGNANAPLVGGPHTYRDVRSIQRDAHRAKVRVSASGPYHLSMRLFPPAWCKRLRPKTAQASPVTCHWVTPLN